MPKTAQAKLISLLQELDDSPYFCVSGSRDPMILGLRVGGVGELGLPIQAADAQRLISVASQAPYGRGEETIVDTEVRRVWQIEPNRFEIRNPQWEEMLVGILQEVMMQFGLTHRVRADLYKLLIYEEGSFFRIHRDSEKQKGMFATLVVGLPCEHTGGTLEVHHNGQVSRVDFGGEPSGFELQFAAFYADCEHQITPITSGYRVCLIYNLSIAKNKKQPTAPNYGKKLDDVKAALAQIFAEHSVDKLAIPLAHQYSELGLDLAYIKGSDRTVVELLAQAAEQMGYRIYLALMHFHQTGAADEDTIDWGWSRYSRRRYWNDDDGTYSGDGVKMEEVIDETLTLEAWLDVEGQPQAFGTMALLREEILSKDDLEEFPFTAEVHEATGNEGVTLERWYHQGVVVLWPEDSTFRLLAKEGQQAAVPKLAEHLDKQKKPFGDPSGCAFAKEIIAHWSKPMSWREKENSQTLLMLRQLQRLGDQSLISKFVQRVLPVDHTGQEGPVLRKICASMGWQAMAAPMLDVFGMQKERIREANVASIVKIFEELVQGALGEEASRTVCVQWGAALFQTIVTWDQEKDSLRWEPQTAFRKAMFEPFFRALSMLGQFDLLEQYLTHVFAHPSRYDLHETLIPAAVALKDVVSLGTEGMESLLRLVEHCIEQLDALTAHPVQFPTDWSQSAKISCKCEDCKKFSEFLHDPKVQVYPFSAIAERRTHLEQTIAKHKLDIDCHTETKGRPYTLVCTKTYASYEQKQRTYETNLQLLDDLEHLLIDEFH